jgi:hypothetical protein
MKEANVWVSALNYLSVQLQDKAEDPVSSRVLGAKVHRVITNDYITVVISLSEILI